MPVCAIAEPSRVNPDGGVIVPDDHSTYVSMMAMSSTAAPVGTAIVGAVPDEYAVEVPDRYAIVS